MSTSIQSRPAFSTGPSPAGDVRIPLPAESCVLRTGSGSFGTLAASNADRALQESQPARGHGTRTGNSARHLPIALMLSIAVSALFGVPAEAYAAQTISAGDTAIVMPQSNDAASSGGISIKKGSMTVGTAAAGEFLDVGRVEGNWLWIPSRGGYVQRTDVLSVPEAIERLTENIRHTPSSSRYRLRARLWDWMGEFDLAIRDLDEAISLSPGDANSFNDRGYLWLQKDAHDRAIADFDASLRLRPTALAFCNRGLSLCAKGEYERATRDFNSALELDSNYPNAHFGRGIVCLAKKEHQAAIWTFDEAERLGFAGPVRAAVDDLPQRRYQLRNKYLLSRRSLALAAAGEYGRAIQDLESLVRFESDDPEELERLAWLLATCPDENHRDGRRAVDIARKACELSGGKGAGIFATLGAAHAESGDFVQAEENLRKALEP